MSHSHEATGTLELLQNFAAATGPEVRYLVFCRAKGLLFHDRWRHRGGVEILEFTEIRWRNSRRAICLVHLFALTLLYNLQS